MEGQGFYANKIWRFVVQPKLNYIAFHLQGHHYKSLFFFFF